jgi:spore germination protein
MKKKNLWIYVIIGCIISIIVIFYMYKNYKEKELFHDSKNNETKVTPPMDPEELKGEKERSINTWTVYWDNENVVEDMKGLGNKVTSLSYFAAYFDANENLFIPDNMKELRSKVNNSDSHTNYKGYLTFVNDVLKSEGGSSLKDTKLLYSLLSSHDNMQNHIDEIIALTIDGGYDGIEIDYEAIKKDKDLWKLFLQFVDDLYGAATEKELLVRILLEPSALTQEIDFPEGPEYVIMCYNLYGYGTEPGPKANKDFLVRMVEKMKDLPGEIGFAVANGGFDFDESGTVKQISTKDAVKKQELHQASSYRDKESGCMVFSYKDEIGNFHEVWYADNIAIDYWFSILEELGENNLYLWRLGG